MVAAVLEVRATEKRKVETESLDESRAFIELERESAEELPSLDELAAAAGLSRFHFHRVFKSVTGLTPKAYEAAHRARRFSSGARIGAACSEKPNVPTVPTEV